LRVLASGCGRAGGVKEGAEFAMPTMK
jgi:hypothetical protein